MDSSISSGRRPPTAPETPPVEVRTFLKPREYLRLLAAAEQSGLRNECLIRVLYECGLRRSEIGFLKLSYCDKLRDRKLYVWRGKGSLAGYVRLSSTTTAKLKEWLKYYRSSWLGKKLIAKKGLAAPLFPGWGYEGLCGRAVYKVFSKLADAAKIPDELRHPHVLKHSRVQHLLAAGVKMGVSPWELFETLAQLVGHVNARTTLQHYVHEVKPTGTFAEQLTEIMGQYPPPPPKRKRVVTLEPAPIGRPKGRKDSRPRRKPRKRVDGQPLPPLPPRED